jgi:hypothetical protein
MQTRLRANKNLTLHTKPMYAGMPVLVIREGLIEDYLAKLHTTIENALQQHSRVLAIRFELLFKEGTPEHIIEGAISRFIEALKYQLNAASMVPTKSGAMPHSTSFRYAWAREKHTSDLPHYHFLLLLSGNAYRAVGNYEMGLDNLYSRIVWAWNSAIKEPQVASYVSMTSGGTFLLERDESYDALFEAGSYLCKAYTKEFSAHGDSFGCSRQ